TPTLQTTSYTLFLDLMSNVTAYTRFLGNTYSSLGSTLAVGKSIVLPLFSPSTTMPFITYGRPKPTVKASTPPNTNELLILVVHILISSSKVCLETTCTLKG